MTGDSGEVAAAGGNQLAGKEFFKGQHWHLRKSKARWTASETPINTGESTVPRTTGDVLVFTRVKRREAIMRGFQIPTASGSPELNVWVSAAK